MTAVPQPAEDLSYEDALAQLEAVIDAMEAGDVPLQELVTHYEKGAALLAHCRRQLETAELKLSKIRETDATQTEPFDPAAETPEAP